MKKYSQPELELLVLTEDIVTASGNATYDFGDDINNDEGVKSWW